MGCEVSSPESGRVSCRQATIAAVDHFEASKVLADYLGARFVSMFAKVKRAEQDRFNAVVSPLDYDWYLKNA